VTGETSVGLRKEIVERMKWEQGGVGWASRGDQREVRVKRKISSVYIKLYFASVVAACVHVENELDKRQNYTVKHQEKKIYEHNFLSISCGVIHLLNTGM
jgi:hypothetical protein